MSEDFTPEEYRTAAHVLDAVGSSLNLADSHTASKDLLRLAQRAESDAYLTELARHMVDKSQDERQREGYDTRRIVPWENLKVRDQHEVIRNVRVLLDKLKADGRYVEQADPAPETGKGGLSYWVWQNIPPGVVYRAFRTDGAVVGPARYNVSLSDGVTACRYFPNGNIADAPTGERKFVTTGEVVPL